jgi:hypothetical protein
VRAAGYCPKEPDEEAEIDRGWRSRLAGKAAHKFPKSFHGDPAGRLVKLSEPLVADITLA